MAIPNSELSDRTLSTASDVSASHEAKYHEYRQSASPLARFVAPLWSQYDSDEEEEIARLTDLEGQADNTAANRRLGAVHGSITSTVNPMALDSNRTRGSSDMHGVSYEMSESLASGGVPSLTATDDRARFQSFASDSTEGRDSDKYVRFGANDTRLMSTNSEIRDRMAQISLDSDPQTLANTQMNSVTKPSSRR
jgi:hypothetical protein